MLRKHIPVVEDPGRICHIGHRIGPVHRDKLERFTDIQIGLVDVGKTRIIRYVRQNTRIDKVRIVDITADADDIRVILPYEAGL